MCKGIFSCVFFLGKNWFRTQTDVNNKGMKDTERNT